MARDQKENITITNVIALQVVKKITPGPCETGPSDKTPTEDDAVLADICRLERQEYYEIDTREMMQKHHSWGKVVQRLYQEFTQKALPNAAIRFQLKHAIKSPADILLASEIMQPVITYFRVNDPELKLEIRKSMQLSNLKFMELYFSKAGLIGVIFDLLFVVGGVVLAAVSVCNGTGQEAFELVSHQYFADSLINFTHQI